MIDSTDEDRRKVEYDDLGEMAKKLLLNSGYVTMNEREKMGDKGTLSVNEMIGMANRVLIEEALKIQDFADSEEAKNLGFGRIGQ